MNFYFLLNVFVAFCPLQSSLSKGHDTALSIISQIGGSVSIVGCVTSVAVYEFFR